MLRLLIPLYLGLCSVAAAAIPAGVEKMQKEMLTTVVKLQGEAHSGSAVIVYSKKHGAMCQTFLLTAAHVVDDMLLEPIKIIQPVYLNGQRSMVSNSEATVVANDPENDLALLYATDKDCAPNVAKLSRLATIIYAGESVVKVGAGLGNFPFMTWGLLSLPDILVEKHFFHLFSANMAEGDSGGGLFHEVAGGYELIGVDDALGLEYLQAPFPISVGVAHMAIAIPMHTIVSFLRNNDYGFILNPSDRVEVKHR
jgi:hypothetical protein